MKAKAWTPEWEREREVFWALRQAGRQRRRKRRPPFTAHGVRVTSGAPRMPYGRSTHPSGHLTHLPDKLLFAWRGGVLVGRMVAWRCGGRSTSFRFVDEPDSRICPACLIERLDWNVTRTAA